MSDSKKHHFVPEFLLSHFSIPNTDPKSIWIHNLKYLRLRKGTPGSTAYQEYLYSFEREGSLDPYWEEQFSKLETEASPIILKIIQSRGGQTLTEDERTKFARFVGYSYARTPQFIGQIENMVVRLSDAVAEAIQGKTEKLRRIAIDSHRNPDEYIEKILSNPSQSFLVPPEKRKEVIMSFINDHGLNVATMIRNDFNWFFKEADSTQYCIADDPVIFYSREEGGGWRHGIAHNDIEIYYPLSPDICFVAFRDMRKFPDFTTDQVNNLSIWQAHKYLFSSVNDVNFDEELARRFEVENIVSRDELLALYIEKSGGFTSGDVLTSLS